MSRPLPSFPVSFLFAASLASLANACASAAESSPESGAPAGAAPAAAAAVDGEVDALLAAVTSLDDLVRHGRLTARATDEYARLERLVNDVAVAVDDLRAAPASPATARLLARRVGQLAPRLRAVRRAIERSDLDQEARAELRARVGRARIAAASLALAARELPELVDADLAAVIADALGASCSPPYVIDEGHVDPIDVELEDDELGISIHDESVDPDVERDPADTILLVKAAAKVELPDDRFAFLGPAGATVWILPQGQLDAEAAGVLWPGISTEEIEPGAFVDDALIVRIRRVTGPDGFALFESPADEESAPVVVADSEDGLPDAIPVVAGTHRHLNWAFEAPGVYRVKVDARGRLADVPGEPWVTSASATLQFVVQP